MHLFFSLKVYAQNFPDYSQIVENIIPSVVRVESRDPNISAQNIKNAISMNGDFEGLLAAKNVGSGFIISNDGYIVTNLHVLRNMRNIVVTLYDNTEFDAEVIGADSVSDLALLKISAEGLASVTFPEETVLKAGQVVLAIGSPFSFSQSVTSGIISYVERGFPGDNDKTSYVSYIQTDLPINPGYSGGPLVNTKGEVVGMNTKIFSNTGSSIGISFSIPTEILFNIINQLSTNGFVTRGWIGVQVETLNQTIADIRKLSFAQGILIEDIILNSPADLAGLEKGDVILAINGSHLISAKEEFFYHLGLLTPGRLANLSVIRSSTALQIDILVGETK